MRTTAPLVTCLVVFLAAPLGAQSQDGHVYSVASFEAHTGQEAQYNSAFRDVLRPIFDHMVERGEITSYLDLVKNTGAAGSTHMVVIEFPSWSAMGEYEERLDQASRAVRGRPWGEVVAERFVPFRESRGSDLYVAPTGN